MADDALMSANLPGDVPPADPQGVGDFIYGLIHGPGKGQ
jgi:hypothetical protein